MTPSSSAARSLARRHAILGLTLLFATFAAVLTLGWLPRLASVHAPINVPWWCLAGGFAAAEVFVVHLERGRETHTFSLVEIPLVVGLFLTSPMTLLTSRLAGGAAALTVHRRQSPQKLAFNLSMFGLETTVALLAFHALAGTSPSIGVSSWPATVIACMAENVVGIIGVSLAIAATNGLLERATLVQLVFETALLGPIANTSVAICLTVLLWFEPAAAILMSFIAGVVVLAYRGYGALRGRYANLTKLYDFNQRATLNGAEQTSGEAVLRAACSVMNAERGYLCLPMADDGFLTVTADDAGNVHVTAVQRAEELAPFLSLIRTNGGPLHVPSSGPPSAPRAELARFGWRDCLAIEIKRDEHGSGVLAVGDRMGNVSTFDREDLTLFSALAGQAEVILANSELLERLQYDLLHDALTGLPNRVQFARSVEAAIRDRLPGRKLAVLLLDLDRFKDVNDTLGHDQGDALLVEVGRRLCDIAGPNATVTRLGGDEYAMLLPAADGTDHIVEHAGTFAEALRNPFLLGDIELETSASIGLALCPDHGEDAGTLLQRADVAMYVAKESGQVETYSPERDRNSRRRLEIVAELRTAIATGQLEVWYQPQADALTRRVGAAEALVRWRHPTRGLIPPDDFIPAAEQTGLIRELTDYVLREVTSQWRVWQRQGIDLEIGVNVSMRNLQDRGFAQRVVVMLAERGVPTNAITIEITESSIMHDAARTLQAVNALADAGFGISVDDFGTGYSSLTHLRELPIREIKIDKSFVGTLDENRADDVAIVRSVIDLARNLNLQVIAEGVETANAWDRLAEWGCDRIQGYFLSKPLPVSDFTNWIREHRAPSASASILGTDHR